MLRLICLGAALAVVAAAPAAAQAPIPDITDQEFVGAAAQSDRFEIATGELAADRGKSRAVRRLGRQFVRHHTMTLEQGAAVAAKLGITPPATMSPAQQAIADRLAKRRGRSFDRAWLRAQIAAHTQAVALHQRGALHGDTADTRALGVGALPIVGAHLGELTATLRR